MNKPLLTLAALAATIITAQAAELTIGTAHTKDATFELYTKLKQAKEMGGSNTIAFEKGTYNFYPEYAYEKYEYFSNHGDRLSRIGCYLNDMKDITIDGNGSEFIFHGIMVPFLVENCEQVTIRDISVDFAEPFHSEALVVNTDTEKGYLDIKFSKEYPFEIRSGELYLVRSYYDCPVGQNYLFDPATGFVAYNDIKAAGIPAASKVEPSQQFEMDNFTYINKVDRKDYYIREQGVQRGIKAEHLGEGVVRLYDFNRIMPKLGWKIIMKGHQGYNRLAPGFKCEDSKGVNLYNLAIHHAAGMGFLGENCEDILLDGCSTTASGDRLVSVTADATHFVGCRGQLTMRGCTFQSQLDDGTNIHGAHQEVIRVVDKHTLGVMMGHHQQMGFNLARRGDKIGIIAPKRSSLPHAELTLASTEVVNGRLHLLTFKEQLPEDLELGYLVENLTAYPEVLIEDCHFSRNRARAILISTHKGGIIRNNFMSTEMGAMSLHGGTGEDNWYECGITSNLLIEGNTMRDCSMAAKPVPIIGFNVHNDKGDGYLFNNIKIINNRFEYVDNWALGFNCCNGVEVSGNTFIPSNTYPQRNAGCSVVTLRNSNEVKFKNNHYEGNAKQMVELIDGMKPVKFK